MSKRNRRDFLIRTGTCATGLVVGATGGKALASPVIGPMLITYITQDALTTQINPDDPDTTHFASFASGTATTLYIHGSNFGNGSVPNDKPRPVLTGVTCKSGVIYHVDFKINEVGWTVTPTLITVPITSVTYRLTSVSCCIPMPPVPTKGSVGKPFRSGDSSIAITTVTPGGNYSIHQVYPAYYTI